MPRLGGNNGADQRDRNRRRWGRVGRRGSPTEHRRSAPRSEFGRPMGERKGHLHGTRNTTLAVERRRLDEPLRSDHVRVPKCPPEPSASPSRMRGPRPPDREGESTRSLRSNLTLRVLGADRQSSELMGVNPRNPGRTSRGMTRNQVLRQLEWSTRTPPAEATWPALRSFQFSIERAQFPYSLDSAPCGRPV